jgi:outer membrane protein insertion porin family
MGSFKRVLLVLLVGTSCTFSQVIRDIKFEGLVHISPQIAQEIVGIKVGSSVDDKKIDESIKRLFAQKYFDDIYVKERSGVLTYYVKEKPVLAKIELDGLGDDQNQEILKSAGIKKGDSYDETKMSNLKKGLESMLESQGYYDSVVDIDSQSINDKALATNINVRKGENIYITKVDMIGLKEFSYEDISPSLANRQRESFGWLLGRDDGKLKASQLKGDKERIRDFYLSRGYLDIKVSDPALRANFNDYTAHITYRVDEGFSYRVGVVNIEVSQDIDDMDEIEEKIRLISGKVFNITKLKADIKSIQSFMSDRGYAFAKVVPDIKPDKEARVVNVTYKVRPNSKVNVGNITISGNSRTVDRVIRRELYLSEGEPFSQIDLKDSVDALKRTGFFSSVNIIPRQVSSDRIDLLVKVEETSTGSIMGGLSYGSYDGLGVNAGVSDKNFLGTGIELGTTIDYSEKTLNGSLRFYNPRLNDSDYSLSGNVFAREFDYYDYDEDTKGANLTLGKRVGRNTHISLGYIYENTKLDELSDSLKDSPYYNEGKSIKSSLVPSITYNNTDDYYLPRRGVKLSLSTEFAGVGGDEKFSRYSVNGRYYHGFADQLDYDLIARARVRVSYIDDRGNLPLNEKLYLGGFSTVRGFKSGTLAPKQDDTDTLIGAKYLASGSVEMSIPVVESMGLRLKAFYDHGMTGEEGFSEIKRDSIGASFEWPKSPLGVPLEIYYAKPLNDKDGDRVTNWELNLGTRF